MKTNRINRIEQIKAEITKLKKEIEADKKVYENSFEWGLEFPQLVGKNGKFKGFDLVIGNPPYGIDLNKYIIENYESKFSQYTSYTKNSVMYFIFLAEQITHKNGFHSMIIPKSFSYSQGWNNTVKFIIDELVSLIDVGKAFGKVLLEQVIYLKQKTHARKNYHAGLYVDDEFSTQIISKNIFETHKLLLAGLTIPEMNVLQKILKNFTHRYSDFVEIKRGLNWQSKSVKNEKLTPVHRGKQLNKYYLEAATDFIDTKKFKKNKYEYQYKPKILNQLALAHVKRPYPHFYLQAAVDFDSKLVFETISCTFSKKKQVDLKFLLGFNNSKLFAWLLYKFIYSNAIRSTRFDRQYVGKIPCPNLENISQENIIKLVDKILKLKEKDTNSDISKLEKQIDKLVYKLYNLTEEEIQIVENE